MTIRELHLRKALAEPSVKADILDLITRRVAGWAWPAAYLKIGTVEEWNAAVRGGAE